MLKTIKLFIACLLLFSCNNSNYSKLEVNIADTIYAKPNSSISTLIKLNNRGSSEISILDYRMSCECVSTDSITFPFLIKAYSEREIPILIKIDSSDIDKVKPITVTCKLKTEPFFATKKFQIVVKN